MTGSVCRSGSGAPDCHERGAPTCALVKLDRLVAYLTIILMFTPYVAINVGNNTSVPMACLTGWYMILRTRWHPVVFWSTLGLCLMPLGATALRLLVDPHPLSLGPYLTWFLLAIPTTALIGVFLVLGKRVVPTLSLAVAASALVGYVQQPQLERGTIPWLWYYQARGVTPVTELANQYNPRPFGLFPEPSYFAGSLTLAFLLVIACVTVLGLQYTWREWLAFLLLIPILLETVSGSLVVTLSLLVACWCVPLVRRWPALLGGAPVAIAAALLRASDVLQQRSSGAFNFSWVDRSSSLVIGLHEMLAGPSQFLFGIGRGMTNLYFITGRMPTHVAMHYNEIPDVYSVTFRVVLENGALFGLPMVLLLACQFLRFPGLAGLSVGASFLVSWVVVAGLTVTYDAASWCWAAPGGMAGLAVLARRCAVCNRVNPQGRASRATTPPAAGEDTAEDGVGELRSTPLARRSSAEAEETRPESAAVDDSISPDPGHRRKRLRRNMVWNYLSGVSSMLGLLVLFPLAVRLAGAHEYGLWVLIFGATLLLSFADFGMGDGIVRQLTGLARDGAGSRERRAYVSVAMAIFGVLTAGLVAIFVVVVPLYLRTVPTSGVSEDVQRNLVAAGAIALAATLLGRAFNAVLWALDRQDIERKASVIGMGFRGLGYAVAAATSAHVAGVVIAEVVGLCVAPAVCMVEVVRRFGPPLLTLDEVRRYAPGLLHLGAVLFAGSLAAIVTFQFPLYVVGSALGLSAATAFGALMRVYQSAKLMNSWTANPFIHALSVAHSDALSGVARQAFRWTLAAGSLVSLGLIGMGPALMRVWLGSEYGVLGAPAALIAIGVLADAVIQPAILAINLRGRPVTVAWLNMLALALVVAAVFMSLPARSLEWTVVAATGPLLMMVPVYVRATVAVTGRATFAGWRRGVMRLGLLSVLIVALLRGISAVLPPILAVVVGGGLFGCVLSAALFRRRRARTTVPDAAATAD